MNTKQHQTVDKFSRHINEFDETDQIPNTTGHKDKKKKALKTLILSGNKVHVSNCDSQPQVNIFCPESHVDELNMSHNMISQINQFKTEMQ